jgi:hypothetical protein
VPHRHVAAAMLPRQMMMSYLAASRKFRAAFRPSNVPVASASMTSAGPRRSDPSKTCCLYYAVVLGEKYIYFMKLGC